MSDWIDKGLKRVALDIMCGTFSGQSDEHEAQLVKVLKRELGPLLEAGQAMADELDDFGDPHAMMCQADWDAERKKLEGKP